jgi:hypothetical protein
MQARDSGRHPATVIVVDDRPPNMPQIQLDDETVAALDGLRVEDESYDEIITELINIYQADERTLFHSGDEY